MSDEGGEKVFPATERKRKDARKKGQVAKSMELSGALVLLALICYLRFALTSGHVMTELMSDFQTAFAFNPHPNAMTIRSTSEMLRIATLWGLRLALPGLLIALAVGLITNIAQVGLQFSPEALAPKWEKLNPLTGMKKLISRHGVFETIKGICKITLIAWMSYGLIMDQVPLLISASQSNLVTFLGAVGELCWRIGIRIAALLFILAIADYAYQKYEYEKNMKMTHTEMKQEIKQQDGDPLIKQRIRQKQRAISQKRMMQQVPKSTVVVTNPTHFAVAILYEAGMQAPLVVAKGQDNIAQRIKEIATENDVPLVENVALARAIYRDVEINREIPADLYKAVAEVLAFVYRTYGKSRSRPASRNAGVS
ncbi:MAG TPA: flagellar biosynthesis protein FlhB [Capsulimonadaceae bacterium]|jgi:flagellar biosynthetic protein FlhB